MHALRMISVFRSLWLTCWTVSNAALIAAKLSPNVFVEFATITNVSHSAVCKSVTAVTGNRIFPVSAMFSTIFNTVSKTFRKTHLYHNTINNIMRCIIVN